MTLFELMPSGLAAAILFPILAGAVTLSWGRVLPRKGDWLTWTTIVLVLTVCISGLVAFGDETSGFRSWIYGWVWPKREANAIIAGFSEDPLGLVVSIASLLLCTMLIANRRLVVEEPRSERVYAAAQIGIAGVLLSWLSATPWLSFAGIILAVFGGFVALGSRWSEEKSAESSVRYVVESAIGALLAFIGAYALAGRNVLLVWSSNHPVDTAGGDAGSMIGAIVLVVGLFLLFHPFPILSWVVKPESGYPALRTVLAQVLPGWAALALLVRIEPILRAFGVFPVFGWFALGCAVLTVASGLFQEDWRASLGTWVSGVFCASVAALAFAGPMPCFALAISGGMAGAALSLFGSALSMGGTGAPAHQQKGTWTKAGCIVATFVGAGMIGFLGAGGSLRWIAAGLDEPAKAAAFAATWFFCALLCFKSGWMVIRSRNSTYASWTAVLFPFVICLAVLGVIWTGSLAGGALPQGTDSVGRSVMSILFGAEKSWDLDDQKLLGASWFHWVALVLAWFTAFWTAGRKDDLWENLRKSAPKLSDFFQGGYDVDRVAGHLRYGIVRSGEAIEWFVDRKAWNEWIPSALDAGFGRVSRVAISLDQGLTRAFQSVARKSTDVPAKVLQLVQSGDVQWYLFFAVGFGIAMLIHFLRF